ncbi:carbohydrate ABC transporter permease [Rhizobium anhuiense]|uniref:carbohydrate ABC transporter permease n=2 Tax=Rhizobium TaxID=379 RepID=UPI0020CF97E5|nr:carbohydrate ABC transporter permease [Rhizobium anhuiense]UTS90833.1 carbohydrate ABC transporter permease [Rhizobium anhuiense bv. trifolii]
MRWPDKVTTKRKLIVTAIAWTLGILIFFPILWTFLTSFKSEADAIASPPQFLFFHWTTENYAEVQSRSNYLSHFMNSVIISFGSTLIGLIIAIPAAWAMAFSPTKRTKDVLMWMLSTKMMPPVGALIPIYLMFRNSGLLDTRTGLVIVLTLINLPIIVWMLYTYFKEIPGEILEAARMDGASLMKEIVYVLTPMAVPGIASTLLLNIILAWNEAFWTLNLTASKAAPLTAFIASYSSPEGLFYAKLSAASTMAIAPILILGWFSQKQLVRGLTFGAVK